MQNVLGVLKGTYDAAFTWTSKGDGFGNIRQMMNQGLLKREHPHHLDLRPTALAAGGDPQGRPGRHARRHAQALYRAAQDRHRRSPSRWRRARPPASWASATRLHPDVPGGRGRARGAAQASEVSFEEQYAAYRRQKRLYAALFCGVFAACLAASWITARFDPVTLFGGLPRTTEFLLKLVADRRVDLCRRRAQVVLGRRALDGSLLNTLLIAYLATVIGTLIGGFLSFFAARNLAQHYAVYWLTRRVLEVARAVPDIVWALLFIIAFGIGPLAGILAITVHRRLRRASCSPR